MKLKTRIMGILNVTPDSFSDGGQFDTIEKAVARGKQMVKEGADSIDVGGESSRPGSERVSGEEEMSRVLPVIERLKSEISIPISIDTYKPEVARAAVGAGATMVNDITGLRNEEMIQTVSELQVPVVIMHMQGEPKTMQENPQYEDVVQDIISWLRDRVAAAREAGIADIITDPGIGFGKTLAHNLQILKRLREFEVLECPILVGPSRKSFLGKITGADVAERLPETLAAVVVAVLHGASIVRVHDVAACRKAVAVAGATLYA